MKTTRWIAASSAMLLAFSSLSPAPAQAEMSYSDLATRIQALENELGSQQVKLASCDSAGCCDTGCTSTSACCASSAWYVGYELTVLRPYISNSGAGGASNLPAGTLFDDEYGFGHRLVLGYDGGSGMGARVRYWFYNHGHDIVAGAGAGTSIGLDMDVLDAEVTLGQQLRNWDIMVSGGARYGRVGLTQAAILGASEVFFEGVGPTASLEATRDFGDRNLYLIGNARTSLLFGDWYNYPFTGALKLEDELTTVFESQLGVGYSRCLGCGATLTLRTVWETQFWMNDTLSDEFNGVGSNLGFAGPTSTLELRF